MSADTSGPAFPRSGRPGAILGSASAQMQMPDVPPHDGMTLRQWYAGMALQGILASRWFAEHCDATNMERPITEQASLRALQYADALLAELAK